MSDRVELPPDDGGDVEPTNTATSSVMKVLPTARHVTYARGRPPIADATNSRHSCPAEPPKIVPPAVPAPAPKPKPKLSKEDKIKLGEALAPMLKPSINNLSDQIKAAESAKPADEKKLYSVIGEGCVPQIEHLAELITHERDKVVEDKEKSERMRAARERIKSGNKALVGFLGTMAALAASFSRKSSTHLIASRVFHNKHQYYIFFPLQLIVASIAIIAFVASYQEGNGNVEVATVLTVIAGFINALDRYLDWRTLSAQHKTTSATYARLKDDMELSRNKLLGSMAHVPAEKKSALTEVIVATVDRYDQQLKTLEQSNGDLQVPLELTTMFDNVENLIHKLVALHNEKVAKMQGEDLERRSCDSHVGVSGIADNMHEPSFIDYVKEHEILVTAYGLLVTLIMKSRSLWCCFNFPYSFPNPDVVLDVANHACESEVHHVGASKLYKPTRDQRKNAYMVNRWARNGDGEVDGDGEPDDHIV